MRNIEIKARIDDLPKLLEKADRICDGERKILNQHDIFFNSSNGRLKLRKEGSSNYLIFYDRPNTLGPKLSSYEVCNFSDRETTSNLLTVLEKGIGVKGEVIKKRHLFMVGQTRIHIDEVKHLGNFMELEVVLKPDQKLEEGEIIAKELCNQLEIKDCDLLDGAYMDLLLKPN